jgi:hypothetical protein
MQKEIVARCLLYNRNSVFLDEAYLGYVLLWSNWLYLKYTGYNERLEDDPLN